MKAGADVFVGERKILYEDADGTARVSVHVFSQDDTGRVTSYLRMYKKEDEEGGQFGRILTAARGTGLGKRLLRVASEAAKEHMHAGEVYIESQKHAQGFYEKSGFYVVSGEFMEAGVPHVEMRKKL